MEETRRPPVAQVRMQRRMSNRGAAASVTPSDALPTARASAPPIRSMKSPDPAYCCSVDTARDGNPAVVHGLGYTVFMFATGGVLKSLITGGSGAQ